MVRGRIRRRRDELAFDALRRREVQEERHDERRRVLHAGEARPPRARFSASNSGSLGRIAASMRGLDAIARGTASSVRRAPATPAAASPNVTPASRPSTSHDRHRDADVGPRPHASPRPWPCSRSQPSTCGPAHDRAATPGSRGGADPLPTDVR